MRAGRKEKFFIGGQQSTCLDGRRRPTQTTVEGWIMTLSSLESGLNERVSSVVLELDATTIDK